MADWFKFYENDLDETRLQYAISQIPEVIPVWVGILSEACRHKVGTVSWGNDEIELFGFSKRLGISIPKINDAVNMLVRIRYITKQDGCITVIKWGEKQSEYCQKRTKMQNQTGEKHHTKKHDVGTVSGHCRDSVGQEERRGEENRGEENRYTYSPLARTCVHLLNELSGASFRESESSLRPIQARLDEDGVDFEGVNKMIHRQVALWKGTEMEKYLRPETLFNKTKFNSYYAARDLPVKNGKPDHDKGF